MRPLLILVACAVTALSATASPARAESLPKRQLVKKANLACKASTLRVRALAIKPEQLKKYFKALARIAEDLNGDLTALEPGAATKDEYGRILADNRKGIRLIKRALAALRRDDGVGFSRQIDRIEVLGRASGKRAKAFGAPACAGEQ